MRDKCYSKCVAAIVLALFLSSHLSAHVDQNPLTEEEKRQEWRRKVNKTEWYTFRLGAMSALQNGQVAEFVSGELEWLPRSWLDRNVRISPGISFGAYFIGNQIFYITNQTVHFELVVDAGVAWGLIVGFQSLIERTNPRPLALLEFSVESDKSFLASLGIHSFFINFGPVFLSEISYQLRTGFTFIF